MTELQATPGLYTAQPAFQVDGRTEQSLTQSLLSLLVEETTAGLYRCELTLLNWGSAGTEPGFLFSDRSLLDFGKKLGVAIGSGDAGGSIFTGRITGLEGRFPGASPPEITILAEDRLQDLRMTRRTRTWEDTSDEELFRAIAAEHSLTPQIDIQGAGPRKVVAQVNQSDLAFLRDRARLIDAELWVDEDRLHVQARGSRRASEVTLTYGQRLQEFSALADIAQQRTKVVVSGWDVAAKEGIAAEATEQAIAAEAGGRLTGAKALQAALGPRVERLAQTVPLTDAEGRAAAESHFRQIARRFVTAAGTAEGDARIRVGTHLTLNGLDPLFSGKYYVTEVRHTWDQVYGFRTHFRAERPWAGE